MMSRTLGAPLGGTMVGGHHGLESVAFSSITPPNFGSGAGIWFPSIVVVALGEPGTPLICCAITGMVASSAMALGVSASRNDRVFRLVGPPQDFAIAEL